MTRSQAALAGLGITVVLFSQVRRRDQVFDIGYVPAVYSVGPAFQGMQRLIVFPLTGKAETSVPLPSPLGTVIFGPSGRTLYASAGLQSPGERPSSALLKIQFNPIRVNTIPLSENFRFRSAEAVSKREDKMVVAGQYWDGAQLVCGVFLLEFDTANVHQALATKDCDDAKSRTGITLSPDGTKAIAIYRHSLELIELTKSTSKIVAKGFWKAAWSPDGKWLTAADDHAPEKTFVLDAGTFERIRTVDGPPPVWSPDSRYLLTSGWQFPCGPYGYTFELTDIETGKRSTVESSKCKVVGNQIGWVDAGILPN
jgi:hypothetical protein